MDEIPRLKSGRFSIIPSRAIDDKRLGRAALNVLSALGTYSDRDGWCYPSQGTIATRMGVHRTAIVRQIKILVDLGYLEKQRRYDEKGSETSSVYKIIFDAVLEPEYDRSIIIEEDGVTSDVTGGVTSDVTGGVTSDVTGGVTSDVTQTPQLTPQLTPHINNEKILEKWKTLFPNKSQPRKDTYRQKIQARFRNKHFAENWENALVIASRSPTLQNASWFNFEFFIRNDTNYQKCLDNWMEWKDKELQQAHGVQRTKVYKDANGNKIKVIA